MVKEIWKDIPGYKGLYQASNLGRIKSLPRTTVNVRNGKRYTRHIKGRIRKPHVHKGDGQVRVSLYKAHGNETNEDLPRLVAKTFIPNPQHYPVVMHKNGGKRDNRACNLYWSSNRQGHVNRQKRKHVSRVKLVKNNVSKSFISMIQASRWLKQALHLTTHVKSIRTQLSRALRESTPKAYGYTIVAKAKHKNRDTQFQLPGEQWKGVPHYEKYYQISNYGRVRRLPTKVISSSGRVSHYKMRIMKCERHNGYYFVTFSKHHSSHKFEVHRLVATAFVPNPHHYPCVNHKDENRGNDKASNLEWCTFKYNNNYGDFSHRISKANGYPISLSKNGYVLNFASIYKAACWLKNKQKLSITPASIRVKLIYGCRQHKNVYGYNVRYLNHRSHMRGKYTSLI